MKYIHPAVLKLLKRVGRYLIKICPTSEYWYSHNFFAVHHGIIFAVGTISLFLFAAWSLFCNWHTLSAILALNNNFFAYRSLAAYAKLTLVFGILIFLCLLYITYAFYLMEASSCPAYLLTALIYILIGAATVLTLLWCVYMYYAYIYLIQIQIICYIDTLSTLQMCLAIMVPLLVLIALRYCATKYFAENTVVTGFCVLLTLLFFNLLIAYIFGPVLLCDDIAFGIASIGREVHICLLCTLEYIYHLLIVRQGPARFGIYEFNVLVSLTGCALGTRIGFRTTHTFIQLCFTDFNFFFISLVVCLLILSYLCISLNFIFELFSINTKPLNYVFIFLFLLVTSFFCRGIFNNNMCIYQQIHSNTVRNVYNF